MSCWIWTLSQNNRTSRVAKPLQEREKGGGATLCYRSGGANARGYMPATCDYMWLHAATCGYLRLPAATLRLPVWPFFHTFFVIVLVSIFDWFSFDLGVILAPNMVQKSIKNRSQNPSIFWMPFGSIFGQFFNDFSMIFRLFLTTCWTHFYYKPKSKNLKKVLYRRHKSRVRGLQHGSKIGEKSIKNVT